ncbi:MAG: hypothetical protein JWO85_1004 [Candidatus Eremiobacteraeota bacterium]|nr:hypothetical protein [Candidatus Eremiobacteraeota bacterium]
MSGREVDVEGLFGRDADSRLLERRRREELGLAAHPASPSSTAVHFGAESMAADDSGAPPRPAALRLALEGRPERDLIPGAVVTVVVAVHDDGEVAVPNATLRIVLPPEAEFVAGSAARDGAELDAEALLGEGLAIGAVPPGEAVRIRIALRVLPGTAPLDVAAHASAAGTPTVAAPALRLRRKTGHTAYAQPRPFYELEAGEDDAAIAAMPAEPAPAARVIDTVLDAPAAPPVLAIAAVPEPPAAPEPPAVPPPPAVAPLAVLSRAIDADEVRALERVFGGAVPHGLAALVLLSSIAAVDGPLGAALKLDQFARSVASALPRALVAARMGRPTPPVVSLEALAAIVPDGDDPAAGAAPAGIALVARFDARELVGLRTVLARTLNDPFLRGAQVLLAVTPRALDNAGPSAAAGVRDALASYRTAGGAWLMRVTVRRAVDRRFDPLVAEDPVLHAAGRALVVALHEAIL